jgi:hypothetical protein
VPSLRIVVGVLALSGAALAQDRAPARWTQPECFAYSAAQDGYACVDFELQSDDEHPREVARVRDVLRWSQRRRAAWGGRRGAVLVTSDSRDEDATAFVTMAEREYALDAPLRRIRSAARVRSEVVRAGYDRGIDTRVALAPGTWQSIAGISLRFETRFHEGDASAYAIGHVLLACGAPPDTATAIDLVREWPRGSAATAFHAAGASSIAISLLEEDGGEGSGHVASRTIVVDVRERCAPPAAPSRR